MDNWTFTPIVTEPIEFRLYYDSTSSVLHYTCEKLEGNFILVDAITFAEARPDIKVIDGRVVRTDRVILVTRLTTGASGIKCSHDDITIIVDQHEAGIYWNIQNYEFGNY